MQYVVGSHTTLIYCVSWNTKGKSIYNIRWNIYETKLPNYLTEENQTGKLYLSTIIACLKLPIQLCFAITRVSWRELFRNSTVDAFSNFSRTTTIYSGNSKSFILPVYWTFLFSFSTAQRVAYKVSLSRKYTWLEVCKKQKCKTKYAHTKLKW